MYRLEPWQLETLELVSSEMAMTFQAGLTPDVRLIHCTCREFRPRWTLCAAVGVQNLEVVHDQSSAGHSAQGTSFGARGSDRQRAKDLPLLRRREVRVLRLEEGV